MSGGVFSTDDHLIVWSSTRVAFTTCGSVHHFDERIEDVQVREDRALVITRGRLYELDSATMATKQSVAASDGEQLLSSVRWSDGDLMTFRGPERYRLLGPGTQIAAVTWHPDWSSVLSIDGFLCDPLKVRLEDEPRRGRYAVLHGPGLEQRYDLPVGARLYNVCWLPGESRLVVDWVAADRQTRTVEVLASGHSRSTLFAETAQSWHSSLAKLCRPHPTRAALLLTTERTGRAAAAVLELDRRQPQVTLTEAPCEVKDAHWSGEEGRLSCSRPQQGRGSFVLCTQCAADSTISPSPRDFATMSPSAVMQSAGYVRRLRLDGLSKSPGGELSLRSPRRPQVTHFCSPFHKQQHCPPGP